MPEGDTIHRAARTLHAALAGKTITRFESVLPQLARVDEDAPLAGRVVERVVAEGKNLIIDFSGGLHLRTHMRMHGSWHLYRSGEKWRRRRSDMRLVIETDPWIAVAFNVPIAEFHDDASLARQEDLARIGPDFAAATFDFDEALRRIRARPDEEIADVLLNQRVVAGIGNEFKNEVLFMSRVNPFAKTRDVTDEQLALLLRTMRKLMLANITKRSAGRITTFSLDPRQTQYVFGRGGKPCRKCGTPIRYAKQGPNARGTYWCPKCQTV
ncbi:MAG: Fpg/Nei family DNA glycosylase [Acidobacteria bacterium]|nr:Fpg/Nei family DNA glycosylase [Acidobacteriota bacterium]MBV9475986.1 Fpg/Nei family DNA glycosylase [Acidobacteriota bacterium]